MSSVQDEYEQLKDKILSACGSMPNKVLTILQLRSEVLRKAANTVSNILVDTSYNIVDVAGSPIIIPNVSAKPTLKPKIEYTGKLTKLEQPYSYVPADGLDVILPPIFMFDTTAFTNTMSQFYKSHALAQVYGVSSLDAPYNGDFRNAVKKVYYNKTLTTTYEAIDSSKTPTQHGYPGYPFYLLFEDSQIHVVRVDWFRIGSITYVYKLSDSETYIRYTVGRFLLHDITDDKEIAADQRGIIIYTHPDDYVKVFYGKHHIEPPYGYMLLGTPEALYSIPMVIADPSSTHNDIVNLLSEKFTDLSVRVVEEVRNTAFISGERIPSRKFPPILGLPTG